MSIFEYMRITEDFLNFCQCLDGFYQRDHELRYKQLNKHRIKCLYIVNIALYYLWRNNEPSKNSQVKKSGTKQMQSKEPSISKDVGVPTSKSLICS